MTVQNNKVINKIEQHDSNSHEDLDLRGTMFSVSIVGGVCLVTWVASFILFLLRM